MVGEWLREAASIQRNASGLRWSGAMKFVAICTMLHEQARISGLACENLMKWIHCNLRAEELASSVQKLCTLEAVTQREGY